MCSSDLVSVDGQIDPEQVLHETEVQAAEAWGHISLGVIWITFGLVSLAPPTTLAGAALIVVGMAEYAAGLRIMRSLVQRPVTILDPLRIMTGADAAEISVASGGSVTLAATADFGTLSSGARSIPHPSIRAIFASFDRIYAAVATATQSLIERVSNLPPALPAQPQVQNLHINPSNLSLVSHTNPRVNLSIANGVLTAASSDGTEQVTTATIRYSVPILGELTATASIRVADYGSHWVGTWQGELTWPGEMWGPVGGELHLRTEHADSVLFTGWFTMPNVPNCPYPLGLVGLGFWVNSFGEISFSSNGTRFHGRITGNSMSGTFQGDYGEFFGTFSASRHPNTLK